jgi:oxidase EvaA
MNLRITNALFLKSAFSLNGCIHSQDSIVRWLARQNEQVRVCITRRPIHGIPGWRYDVQEGRIRHDSGKFFSVDGVCVRTNWVRPFAWNQPIINQPEVGYLGIIAKEFNGILHFLLQAKIEPGNVNHVQLSPTLQATRSNYTCVHHGREPLYLNFFRNARPEQVLLDQLQSEQGARFLRKRNRNIIIKVDDEVPLNDQFVWLTLGQIKALIRHDNLVNMDTRTVISGISFGEFAADVIDLMDFLAYDRSMDSIQHALLKTALTAGIGKHTVEDIIAFLTHLKSTYDLEVERVPLHKLDDWRIEEMSIRHKDNKYFKVIAVDVEIENREVQKWSQPMIEPAQAGLCAFVCKEIGGLMHFAVQAKMECGNHDIVEFAPTVQCLTGNYRDSASGNLPFLDYVLNAPPDQIIFDTLQSEEGGRFFQEQNRNLVVLAGEDVPEELPPRYIWMTLNQIQTFLKFNNYLNIQARSLISALSFA